MTTENVHGIVERRIRPAWRGDQGMSNTSYLSGDKWQLSGRQLSPLQPAENN